MQIKHSPCKRNQSPSLLFFDIDGTILSETTGQISENTINAIQQAQQNGHLVFINSGRTICGIEDAIKSIGFDGYVCGCGTYIEYNGQVLLSKALEKTLAHQLIEDIQRYNLDAILEGASGIYFGHEIQSPDLLRVRHRQMNVHHFPVSTWDDPDVTYDKFCICLRPDSDYQGFYEKYHSQFEFIDRGNEFFEIIPHGCSKATGIEFLMNHLNIPYDNTFGLGDSTNDLPMLEFVKNSIAMGNCTPFLRDIVSFVTKDVDRNGIEYALQHYQLI